MLFLSLYACPPPRGGFPNKKNGGSHQKFWKEPLRGIKILFCGCGLNFFLNKYKFYNNILSLVVFFWINTITGTTNWSSLCLPFKAKHPKRYQNCFLSTKRCNKQPHFFIYFRSSPWSALQLSTIHMCITDEIQLHFTNDYTLLVIDLKVSQELNVTYFSNLSKNKTRIIYLKCVIFKTVKGRVLCIRINKQCIKFFANLWSRFSNWLVKITYIIDCADCLKKALLSV